MMRCVDVGKQHGEVITADDDEGRWDPEVFAAYRFLPPNKHQWGYCVDCRQPFRWSVIDQRWRAWPGGMALLPHYTDEELEVLQSAVLGQAAQMDAALEGSQSEGMRAELAYRRALLHSLSTSVAEARYHLWPPEGSAERRLYINVRIPVGNADVAGAIVVCKELLAGERPGELAVVADRVWIGEAGRELALVKQVADAGDDPAAPSV